MILTCSNRTFIHMIYIFWRGYIIKTQFDANIICSLWLTIQANRTLVSMWTYLCRMTVWRQYFSIWKDRKKWGVRGLLELRKFSVTCWEWIAQSSWNIPHSNGLRQSLVFSLCPYLPFSFSLPFLVSHIIFSNYNFWCKMYCTPNQFDTLCIS